MVGSAKEKFAHEKAEIFAILCVIRYIFLTDNALDAVHPIVLKRPLTNCLPRNFYLGIHIFNKLLDRSKIFNHFLAFCLMLYFCKTFQVWLPEEAISDVP